jgi:hypothetical protein
MGGSSRIAAGDRWRDTVVSVVWRGREIVRTALVDAGYPTDTPVAENMMSRSAVVIAPLFIYYAEHPPDLSIPAFEGELAGFVRWIIEENGSDIDHLLDDRLLRLSALLHTCDRQRKRAPGGASAAWRRHV